MINNTLIGDSISLLIKIRRECCDGRTNIEIDDFNKVLMNHLIKNDLVICRISKPSIVNNYKRCFYVGISDKARPILKGIGVY